MALGDLVHWYDTSGCVLDCPGCFRKRGLVEGSLRKRREQARILVQNGVKQVNFGNGEPLLVSGLEEILGILHEAGIKTEIHTNAVLLDQKRIDRLAPVTDVIALPIDSLRPEIQQRIRGKGFMPVFYRFRDLVQQIQDAGIHLGYHTVFTAINSNDVLPLWRFLNNLGDFDYWRVYEFNGDLSVPDLKSADEIKRYRTVQRFGFQGTIKRLQTDCLFAKFILKEEEMARRGDERVQFVGVHDPQKEPYLFLDGQGNATTYTWFGTRNRPYVGNIFKDGFPEVIRRLKRIDQKQMESCAQAEEDFVETEALRPLWVRVWEGNFSTEDFVRADDRPRYDPRFASRFSRLTNLYVKRRSRLLNAA